MIAINCTIEKYGAMGEKTGWTIVIIPQNEAIKLHSKDKKAFRIKGVIDNIVMVEKLSLIPLGNGDYIMPLNQKIRKEISKKAGEVVNVSIEIDNSPIFYNPHLIECLEAENNLIHRFETSYKASKRYLSKWVDDAKTPDTIVRRITAIITGIQNNYTYQEIIKYKNEKM